MDIHHINLEETIGKTVGRRTRIGDPVRYGLALQSNMPKKVFGSVAKGVYKFSSHEEADQWMMDHLLKKARS